MRLGSTTMRNAPFSSAPMTREATIGWFSVVLDPVIRIHDASSRSGIEFVIAPLPNALARPATVGAWQRRAQWSMLFVPITALANFMKAKFSSFVHLADERKPIESGPYLSLIALSLSATKYSAVSQSVDSRLAPLFQRGRRRRSSLSTNS